MLVKLRVLVWSFVSMTIFAGLVEPAYHVPKAMLVAESVTGSMPVPLRPTVCGLVDASSVTVSVAVLLPIAEGVRVTVMVQLFFAPSVAGLIGQLPPVA